MRDENDPLADVKPYQGPGIDLRQSRRTTKHLQIRFAQISNSRKEWKFKDLRGMLLKELLHRKSEEKKAEMADRDVWSTLSSRTLLLRLRIDQKLHPNDNDRDSPEDFEDRSAFLGLRGWGCINRTMEPLACKPG